MYQFKQEFKNNQTAKDYFQKIKYDDKFNNSYIRVGFIDFKLADNYIIGQSFVLNEYYIRDIIYSL